MHAGQTSSMNPSCLPRASVMYINHYIFDVAHRPDMNQILPGQRDRQAALFMGFIHCKGNTCINPALADTNELFLSKWNIYLICPFPDTAMTQIKTLPCGIQGPIYTACRPIAWLLMSWRRKEPGHQQPRYWHSSLGILLGLRSVTLISIKKV